MLGVKQLPWSSLVAVRLERLGSCRGDRCFSRGLFVFAALCDFWITGEVHFSPYCSLVPRSALSLDLVCAIDELLTRHGVDVPKRFAQLRAGRMLTML